VVEEGRVKRPYSEVLPTPEKKVKIETEEDAKALEAQVAPKQTSNTPKILTLDEIKSKKQARRAKKAVKAELTALDRPSQLNDAVLTRLPLRADYIQRSAKRRPFSGKSSSSESLTALLGRGWITPRGALVRL
jgi:hypothetical protein